MIVERDEALDLLSRAREAWAKWLLPYRRAHSHGCGKRSDGTGETCTCGLADLSKILGTGETT